MSDLWARTTRSGRFTLSVLLLGLTLFLVHGDWLGRWDQLIYDTHLKLWSRPAPDDVLIVAIDESSLAALGPWPWPRRIHAQLLQRLSDEGARVIALDIIFAEDDARDPEGDRVLAEALRHSGRAVLPVIMEQTRLGGQLIEGLPIPLLAEAAAGLGHVNVELDPDGIARSVYLQEGLGDPYWSALSVAMLRLGEPNGWDELPGRRNTQATFDAPQIWVRDHHILIPFAGPPGHFPRISYVQVLKGQYAGDTFRDKYVLVGLTATGLRDTVPTPVSGYNQFMPGVEFNANVLDTLRLGIAVQPLELHWRMVLSGLLVLLPVVLYPRFAPRSGLALVVLLIFGSLGLSTGLLRVASLWFPPATVLLVLGISYPLWAWRRLEYAMRYLNQELARLHAEQVELPTARVLHCGPTMTFLKELLPMRGWVLQDMQGRTQASGGDHAGERPAAIPAGDWDQHGQVLWTALYDQGREWRLGLFWNGSQPPDAAQRRLLMEVVNQFTRRCEPKPSGTVEVVRARIQQLEEATDRMRAMRRFVVDSLAQMADGVLVVSSLGQVLLANQQAARYLCEDPQIDLVGRALLDLLGSVDIPDTLTWQAALRHVVLQRLPVQLNARHRQGRDLLVQMTPLAQPEARLGGLIINLSDISALKASERKRGEILGFLSHDLRSPLVSVLALLELAKDKQSLAAVRELLGRIENYTGKTLELAEQFLHLARVESSEELPLHEVELVTVALNAFEQSWAPARAKRIELKRQFDVDNAWVRGDAGLLERAIINLLTNAIKYSPASSTVCLIVSESGGQLRCCVVDNGRGIAANDLPKLFDRFQRLYRSGQRMEHGTGLGLAFVKAVAERHGGRVEVESTLGKGSRFCLILAANSGGATDSRKAISTKDRTRE